MSGKQIKKMRKKAFQDRAFRKEKNYGRTPAGPIICTDRDEINYGYLKKKARGKVPSVKF